MSSATIRPESADLVKSSADDRRRLKLEDSAMFRDSRAEIRVTVRRTSGMPLGF
jgi:hypothetical protein